MLKKVGNAGYIADGGYAVTPIIGAARTVAGIRWKVRKTGTTWFKYVKSLDEARNEISTTRGNRYD